jgi:hypothetical protein
MQAILLAFIWIYLRLLAFIWPPSGSRRYRLPLALGGSGAKASQLLA